MLHKNATDKITNILFIETGQAGGGSFGSLYLLLENLDQSRFSPVAVYLNYTHWESKVEELKVPAYYLTDYRYSLHANPMIRRVLNYLARRIERHFGRWYIYFERFAHFNVISSLGKIIKKHNIDIVHLNNQINRDFFGALAAKNANVPCVSHFRSLKSEHFGESRAAHANKLISHYIFASQHVMGHWLKYGIDKRRTSLIYNGIPNIQLDNTFNIRKLYNIDESIDLIIGCVANLVWWKGHSQVIEAVSLLIQKFPNMVLLIVGDGGEKENLVELVEKLNLKKNVVFLGYQKNSAEIIHALDVLILPSLYDVCSRVILEGLQLQTPVITSDEGGNPELIEHRRTGLLFKYGDINSLAEMIEEMLLDKTLRASCVVNGEKLIREKFSLDEYVFSVEKIYAGIS